MKAPSMKKLYEKLPETPGVYIMKGKKGKILYIGKAVNLKRRVSSYFQKAHNARLEKLVNEIKKIDVEQTDSALEALILESALIKKHRPEYNIREKDDKSFLYVEITREPFPRILLVRGKNLAVGTHFGPFIYAMQIREALKILRRIFPWNIHDPDTIRKPASRPCFEHQIGLCPGTCVGAITKLDYKRNIRKIKLFFEGKKKQIIRELEREMKTASTNLAFECAAKIKRQIFALTHIHDIALIKKPERETVYGAGEIPKRIEGYDISNISGTAAVGSMVVFAGDKPDKSQYRKFKIRTITKPDDTGMLKEVLTRRLTHREWSLPDLMLIDGGKGQVNITKKILAEHGMKIPVVGIAKGPTRKKNEFIGTAPKWAKATTLIRVRNEAHRFAITYHRKVRGRAITKRT